MSINTNNHKIPITLSELQYYTTEEINKVISLTKQNNDLLIFYIDYIRNYKELTKEMLEKISTFDDNSKMIIIKEYNNVIKLINILLC